MKNHFWLLLSFLPLWTAAQQVGVAATELNRSIYHGIKYTISIMVPNTSPEQITAKISSGYIKKLDGYDFELSTYAKDNVTVSVFVNDVSVGKQVFKTLELPKPRIGFCKKCCGGGTHSLSVINGKKSELQFRNPDIGVGVPYEVLKFETETKNMGDDFSETHKSNGKYFSDAQKKAVANMQRGGRLVIQNIEMRFPDGTVQKIGPFTFKNGGGIDDVGCNDSENQSSSNVSNSNVFRINSAPDLASVMGKTSPYGQPVEISLTELLGVENVDFAKKSYGLYNVQKITGFDLTYSNGKEILLTESSANEFITSAQRNLIKSGKPNDLYFFENIEAVSAEGKTLHLNSIAFIIK